MTTCKHADSGCNYPEGECVGVCMEEAPQPDKELDAWRCDDCGGQGWFWQLHHINHGPEIGVESVELRTPCDHCDGVGWYGPDALKAYSTESKAPRSASHD